MTSPTVLARHMARELFLTGTTDQTIDQLTQAAQNALDALTPTNGHQALAKALLSIDGFADEVGGWDALTLGEQTDWLNEAAALHQHLIGQGHTIASMHLVAQAGALR